MLLTVYLPFSHNEKTDITNATNLTFNEHHEEKPELANNDLMNKKKWILFVDKLSLGQGGR